MKFKWQILYLIFIVVFSFYSWEVYKDADVPAITLNYKAQEGKYLWQQHNCISCHQLYGLGGFMGPDLTNVLSDPTKGELYVEAILKSGMNRMPKYNFSNEEINNIIEFLKHTDQSGIYPYKDFKIHYDGTVSNPAK